DARAIGARAARVGAGEVDVDVLVRPVAGGVVRGGAVQDGRDRERRRDLVDVHLEGGSRTRVAGLVLAGLRVGLGRRGRLVGGDARAIGARAARVGAGERGGDGPGWPR